VNYRIRFAKKAGKELEDLYRFLAKEDHAAAAEAMAAIDQALALLERFSFSCRKAADGKFGTFVREFVVPFVRCGYVLLFEIDDKRTVTILSARHQREHDFY
jgi:plasmid stabilization system protein ParE